MKFLTSLLATLTITLLASCAPSRTPFTPGGPTTVGMPEKLSDRERTFIPEIDNALRNEGLVPVKYGKGDLQLDFSMSSGPINIVTRIELMQEDAVLFSANGRSGGVPLVGRDDVARKSFDQAFEEFKSGLSRSVGNGSLNSAASENTEVGSTDEEMPVY